MAQPPPGGFGGSPPGGAPPPGGFGGPPGGAPPPGGFGGPPGGQSPGGQPPGGYGPPPGGHPPGGYGPPPGGYGQPPGGYGPPPGGHPPGGYGQPPGAYGPAGFGQGARQQMGMRPQGPPLPKWVRIVGLVFLGLGILGVLATMAAGYNSESAGMSMASLTAGPLAFGIIVTALSGKDATGSAAKPIGCGCGAWIAAGMVLFFFFTAIWPSL